MTTSGDLALVDTNVLVYAFQQGSPHHAPSRILLDEAQAGGRDLAVVSQILTEFYAVVTNPRRVTEPRPPEEALSAIDQLLVMPGLMLLPTPLDIVRGWTALVRRHLVTGAAVFDLQLVAAMLANGVNTIYTFNTAHFQHFAELTVLTP